VFFGLVSVRSSNGPVLAGSPFFSYFRFAPTPGQPGGGSRFVGSGRDAECCFVAFFFFFCCGVEEGEGNVRPRQGACVLAALQVCE
jgi:hypothetical protein